MPRVNLCAGLYNPLTYRIIFSAHSTNIKRPPLANAAMCIGFETGPQRFHIMESNQGNLCPVLKKDGLIAGRKVTENLRYAVAGIPVTPTQSSRGACSSHRKPPD